MTVPELSPENAQFRDMGDGTRHLRKPGENVFSWQARRLTNTRTFASLDQESENSQMKRVLTVKDLSAMGVGAIIGTGIFVLTGVVANEKAGPAVCVSFIIAAIVAGLAAMSYAEMACLVPIAGSAYTYTYATCGELMAWIIGWDLILEYLVGAATVSVGFSHYLSAFFKDAFGWEPDSKLMTAPFQYKNDSFSLTGDWFSLPSFLIVIFLTILLCRGVKSSARVNNVLVVVKLIVIIVFIFGACKWVDTNNFKPFIPPNTGKFGEFGGSGVLRGATVVFFAFIGFDAISTAAQEARNPQRDLPIGIGISLIGCTILYIAFNGWASPKDVILHIAGQLSVRGGTGHIIEYFGPGVETLSCTGMATISNMGAEVGATTSVFPYGDNMQRYLHATRRAETAKAADKVAADYLRADAECSANPERYYDHVLEVNLSALEPHLNGPFTPDLATPISKFKELVKDNGWKDEVQAGLIGSCTNSSYQDMDRVLSIARQAQEHGLQTKSQFLVTPGSEQIRATAERDGHADAFRAIGGQMLANACGPCIGQWARTSAADSEGNAIITSFNRNFRGRNDGNPNTMNFIASPEIVLAFALSGKLTFNPMTDSLTDSKGKSFKLQPPVGNELPANGFDAGDLSFRPDEQIVPDAAQQVIIDPTSARLQALEPFAAWDGKELTNLRVLVRVHGKCTTDHISAAGPWLKYKGHLENIANNTLIGAVNADSEAVNLAVNAETGQENAIPEVAKQYKAANIPWLIVADHNYGEGSAREHAAMQPRYLGGRLIVARSFARIHETNLKKQGILPLTFVNESDYELFKGGALVETHGLADLVNGVGDGHVSLQVTTVDGQQFSVATRHTMSEDQLAWFRAGSALNLIASAYSQLP